MRVVLASCAPTNTSDHTETVASGVKIAQCDQNRPTLTVVENLVVQEHNRAHKSFASGQTVRLLVKGSQRAGPIIVFVEESKDTGLILRIEKSEQARLKLSVGDAVELGFGFRVARMHFVCPSTVSHINGALVTLTPPKEAKKQPRRSYSRVSYRWPARITFRDGSVRTGVTCNVSASGALIRLEDARAMCCDLEEVHNVVLTSAAGRDYNTDFRIMRSIREEGHTTIAIHYQYMPEVERVRLELAVLRGIARRYLRVSASLKCSAVLQTSSREISVRGETENVSGGGALIRCEESRDFDVGMRGNLVLEVEGVPLHLTDVIVNRVLDLSDGKCRMVLEFPHIGYATRVKLVEFLKMKLGASRDV